MEIVRKVADHIDGITFRINGDEHRRHIDPLIIQNFDRLGIAQAELMETAAERLGLSARAYDRVLKVARTIADLDGVDDICEAHLLEAIGYRALDRAV